MQRMVMPPQPTPKSLAAAMECRAVDVLKTMIKLGESPLSADEPLVPVRIVLDAETLPETLQSGMQADVRVNVAPYKRLW